MTTSNIEKKLVVQNNESIAVFEENGAIYRIESIAEYIRFGFKNLKTKDILTFALSESLLCDVELIGVEVNMKADDENFNHIPGHSANVEISKGTTPFFARASFGILENGVLINQFYFDYLKPEPVKKGILLSPGQDLKISVNKDITSVTLICKKVVLEPVVYPPLVTV